MREAFQGNRTCLSGLFVIWACAALAAPISFGSVKPSCQDNIQLAAPSKTIWKGNRIVSRVLPYSDFVSLFIRLPIAHCAADGKGVKIVVLYCGESQAIVQQVRDAAPKADIVAVACGASDTGEWQIQDDPAKLACRVALIAEPNLWPSKLLVETAQALTAAKSAVVVPSDMSEKQEDIDTIKRLHELGCLTVGRVGRQSMLFNQVDQKSTPFNPMIRSIETDVFSTVGQQYPPVDPAATAAGVAALVAQKKPDATPAQIRAAIVQGARKAWQATSFENQGMSGIVVDPTTTEYRVLDEGKIFRFRVLDAAGALGVDTEIPWFLNMMNCQEAWKITKGKGTTAVLSDQGFHIKHPALAAAMVCKEHFGPLDFSSPDQNFHGTDMSRILLAVAPEAKIVPILCSAPNQQRVEFGANIARSFEYAAD